MSHIVPFIIIGVFFGWLGWLMHQQLFQKQLTTNKALGWRALAKAQGWPSDQVRVPSARVEVRGTLAEQAFQVRAPMEHVSTRPSTLSIAFPPAWRPLLHAGTTATDGRLTRVVSDQDPSIAVVYESFEHFNAILRELHPQWDTPPPGWAGSEQEVVWPILCAEVGKVWLEARLSYRLGAVHTHIRAHCAIRGAAFRVAHAAHGQSKKKELLGSPVLDQLLHASGQLGAVQGLFTSPSATEATLAVLHGYPGAVLDPRGLHLTLDGAGGDALHALLQDVARLAEHVDQLPATEAVPR